MSDCELRSGNGLEAVQCDEDCCVFWRALRHLGSGEGNGCAIQHFQLLADDNIAAWLLSVKERVERTIAEESAAEAVSR